MALNFHNQIQLYEIQNEALERQIDMILQSYPLIHHSEQWKAFAKDNLDLEANKLQNKVRQLEAENELLSRRFDYVMEWFVQKQNEIKTKSKQPKCAPNVIECTDICTNSNKQDPVSAKCSIFGTSQSESQK